MSSATKRMKKAYSLYDKNVFYTLDEAIDILMKYKESASAKFDESVDTVIKLGVDTDKPDQVIKSFVELPHGNGKKAKIIVFANDDNIDKALSLGAIAAGGDELIDKVARGEITDFDKVVATTVMMPKLAKIAKILGPKGLMPSPKLGTVVNGSVVPVVQSLIKGRSNFKTEKDGCVKLGIGKMSFGKEKIIENFKEIISVIKQLKPSSVKDNYFNSIILSSTMGVKIKIKMSDIYSI
jgi:large subunit ribosomal protein L1